jgi:hypothetical protein
MTTKADEQRERAGTYFSHTHSNAGGRFAAVGAMTVVGQTPNPYPALPDNSPWHSDPVPAELPLGYRIDQMIPSPPLLRIRVQHPRQRLDSVLDLPTTAE